MDEGTGLPKRCFQETGYSRGGILPAATGNNFFHRFRYNARSVASPVLSPSEQNLTRTVAVTPLSSLKMAKASSASSEPKVIRCTDCFVGALSKLQARSR